mmetsp:Transcript_25710/g.75842  ORF Transcript_25710/g.75842 Transcript_25710/m.75842 type:complete len:301 (-) Transcript_25710:1010-1912(-)
MIQTRPQIITKSKRSGSPQPHHTLLPASDEEFFSELDVFLGGEGSSRIATRNLEGNIHATAELLIDGRGDIESLGGLNDTVNELGLDFASSFCLFHTALFQDPFHDAPDHLDVECGGGIVQIARVSVEGIIQNGRTVGAGIAEQVTPHNGDSNPWMSDVLGSARKEHPNIALNKINGLGGEIGGGIYNEGNVPQMRGKDGKIKHLYSIHCLVGAQIDELALRVNLSGGFVLLAQVGKSDIFPRREILGINHVGGAVLPPIHQGALAPGAAHHVGPHIVLAPRTQVERNGRKLTVSTPVQE